MVERGTSGDPIVIGRYAIFEEVARGGMAAVHAGRLCGPGGFTKTVAVKRLHPAYASDPGFVAMFLDEARLAARIQHPNVVSVMDVVATKGELFMVMEYVHGESLANLLRAAWREEKAVPPEIAVNIAMDLLFGLHAAHEARTADKGAPLGIVHRDVSPQNVLVGADGVARVVDFGVAKAAQRMHETRDGTIKGKLAYMSPEQLSGQEVDRRTDIWAASVVLWEVLAGRRLFDFDELGQTIATVLGGRFDPPSKYAARLPAGLDAIVMKGLAIRVEDRWSTAEQMGLALEAICRPAGTRMVARWVENTADDRLRERADIISRTENKAIPQVALAGTSELQPRASVTDSQPLISGIRSSPTPTAGSAALPMPTTGAAQPTSRRRLAVVVVGASLGLAFVGGGLTLRALSTPRTADASGAMPGLTATASVTEPRLAPSLSAPPEQSQVIVDAPAPGEARVQSPATPPAHPHGSSTKTRARVASHAAPVAPTATEPAAPSPSPPPGPPPEPALRVVTPAPEPARPRFVLASARVDVSAPTNVSGTTSANVNRIVAPLGSRLTECYRAALPRMRDPLDGSGNVHLETDEDGVIVRVQASGVASTAGPCITSAFSGRKIANVDTGRVRADVPLVFKAQ